MFLLSGAGGKWTTAFMDLTCPFLDGTGGAEPDQS